jgi:hypothetical protein
MLIDHCCAAAGVSHPFHQLAQASAGSSRHRVAGMAKIVKVQVGQARVGKGNEPQIAEV